MNTDTTQTAFLHHPQTGEAQVIGTFYEVELYPRERAATQYARQIREATDRPDDGFTEPYAFIVTYTAELAFNFSDDASPYLRSLETWWQMIQDGTPASECYLYMVQNVHGQVIRELRQVATQARELWPETASPTAQTASKQTT